MYLEYPPIFVRVAHFNHKHCNTRAFVVEFMLHIPKYTRLVTICQTHDLAKHCPFGVALASVDWRVGERLGTNSNHESTGFKVETLLKYSCDAESSPPAAPSHIQTHSERVLD